MRSVAAVALLVGLALFDPHRASAYSVGSAFTDPCHELITDRAGEEVLLTFPVSDGVIPDGGNWREISRAVLKPMGIDPDKVDDQTRLLLTSLIIGVRAPDTDGHSVLNLSSLKAIHADPSPMGQYKHHTRGPDDDYELGNAAVITGTRTLIGELLDTARSLLALPAEQQIVHAPVYVDFYGIIDTAVWGPLFYVGRAAHALQDSFSHTIRSREDGFKKIVHVVNYIDAITFQFDEDRDGIAHSGYTDRCKEEDLTSIVDAAVAATAAFFAAVKDEFDGESEGQVDRVLDEWMTLKPGCTKANEFCGNADLLALTRREPTVPYIKAVFDCAVVAPGNARDGGRDLLRTWLSWVWLW